MNDMDTRIYVLSWEKICGATTYSINVNSSTYFSSEEFYNQFSRTILILSYKDSIQIAEIKVNHPFYLRKTFKSLKKHYIRDR